MLSRAAVIVLLTIRNGLTFPARARILQKPFAIEKLLTLVASDMTRRRDVTLDIKSGVAEMSGREPGYGIETRCQRIAIGA